MSKIFITGGAYQGKLVYAKEYYKISDDEILDFEKIDIGKDSADVDNTKISEENENIKININKLININKKINENKKNEIAKLKTEKNIIEKFIVDNMDNKKCFYNCHLFVKWAVKNGVDVIGTWEKIVSPLCISEDWYVIMDEIGNGIIPLDRFERNYREQAGIFGCYLAERADEVVRVICGIGNRIK